MKKLFNRMKQFIVPFVEFERIDSNYDINFKRIYVKIISLIVAVSSLAVIITQYEQIGTPHFQIALMVLLILVNLMIFFASSNNNTPDAYYYINGIIIAPAILSVVVYGDRTFFASANFYYSVIVSLMIFFVGVKRGFIFLVFNIIMILVTMKFCIEYEIVGKMEVSFSKYMHVFYYDLITAIVMIYLLAICFSLTKSRVTSGIEEEIALTKRIQDKLEKTEHLAIENAKETAKSVLAVSVIHNGLNAFNSINVDYDEIVKNIRSVLKNRDNVVKSIFDSDDGFDSQKSNLNEYLDTLEATLNELHKTVKVKSAEISNKLNDLNAMFDKIS